MTSCLEYRKCQQKNKSPIGIIELRLCFFFLENGNVTDPQYNAILRATLEECRKNNMPKETIDRSIKRAVRFS